jgi:hypothetical protein
METLGGENFSIFVLRKMPIFPKWRRQNEWRMKRIGKFALEIAAENR